MATSPASRLLLRLGPDVSSYGGGERVAALAVVAEQVLGGAAGSQQHRVAGSGEPGGCLHDPLHRAASVLQSGLSLVAARVDDGHIGRVSRKGVGDDVAVAAEQHDAAQPAADGGHQVVEAGALGEPAGDPHDGVVGLERGLGGVRVGGLGVVDPGDVVGHGDGGDPVAVEAERPQPVADRHLGDAVGAGQRRRGQRVGDEVRRRRGEVADRAQLGRAGLPLRDERPVDEEVLDHADHADGGRAEGEADGAGALDHVGLADQPLGLAGRRRCRRRPAAPARRCGPCRRRSRPSRSGRCTSRGGPRRR